MTAPNFKWGSRGEARPSLALTAWPDPPLLVNVTVFCCSANRSFSFIHISREAEIPGSGIYCNRPPASTRAAFTKILVCWKADFRLKIFAIRPCWLLKRTRYGSISNVLCIDGQISNIRMRFVFVYVPDLFVGKRSDNGEKDKNEEPDGAGHWALSRLINISCFSPFSNSGDQVHGNHFQRQYCWYVIRTSQFWPNSIGKAVGMLDLHRPIDINELKDDVRFDIIHILLAWLSAQILCGIALIT